MRVLRKRKIHIRLREEREAVRKKMTFPITSLSTGKGGLEIRSAKHGRHEWRTATNRFRHPTTSGARIAREWRAWSSRLRKSM